VQKRTHTHTDTHTHLQTAIRLIAPARGSVGVGSGMRGSAVACELSWQLMHAQNTAGRRIGAVRHDCLHAVLRGVCVGESRRGRD